MTSPLGLDAFHPPSTKARVLGPMSGRPMRVGLGEQSVQAGQKFSTLWPLVREVRACQSKAGARAAGRGVMCRVTCGLCGQTSCESGPLPRRTGSLLQSLGSTHPPLMDSCTPPPSLADLFSPSIRENRCLYVTAQNICSSQRLSSHLSRISKLLSEARAQFIQVNTHPAPKGAWALDIARSDTEIASSLCLPPPPSASVLLPLSVFLLSLAPSFPAPLPSPFPCYLLPLLNPPTSGVSWEHINTVFLNLGNCGVNCVVRTAKKSSGP